MVDWIRCDHTGSSGCYCSPKASIKSAALGRNWWAFDCSCAAYLGGFQASNINVTDDFHVLVLTIRPTARKATQASWVDACRWDCCVGVLDGCHCLRQEDYLAASSVCMRPVNTLTMSLSNKVRIISPNPQMPATTFHSSRLGEYSTISCRVDGIMPGVLLQLWQYSGRVQVGGQRFSQAISRNLQLAGKHLSHYSFCVSPQLVSCRSGDTKLASRFGDRVSSETVKFDKISGASVQLRQMI